MKYPSVRGAENWNALHRLRVPQMAVPLSPSPAPAATPAFADTILRQIGKFLLLIPSPLHEELRIIVSTSWGVMKVK